MTDIISDLSFDDDSDTLIQTPAVVLAAAPGDEVIGTGAALWKFSQKGKCHIVIAFRRFLPYTSETEEVLAPSGDLEYAGNTGAEILGYDEPLYWALEDAGIIYCEELISRILSVIEATGAKIVYAPSPEEEDTDRFALGIAAHEAVRRYSSDCLLAFYGVSKNVEATHSIRAADALDAKRKAFYHLQRHGDYENEGCTSPRTIGHNTRKPSLAGAEYEEMFCCMFPARDIFPLPRVSDAARWPQLTPRLTEPLVSIVVRTTVRPELATTLDSIAAQTYRHIEVVLVDVLGNNALPGHSYCGEFPVRKIGFGTPLNRSAAANAGVDTARGDFVVLLDDDDWIYPDHVIRLVSAIRKSNQFRAAYSGIECRSANDIGGWDRVRIFNDEYDPMRLLVENFIPMHAMLFERSLHCSSLRFDEALQVYEDWDFWIQLSQNTNLCHVDKITGVYRVSSSSGFGVRTNDPAIRDGIRALFGKWRDQWTLDQLVGIIEFLKRNVQASREDVQRLSEEREAIVSGKDTTIAELSMQLDKLKYADRRYIGVLEELERAESARQAAHAAAQKRKSQCDSLKRHLETAKYALSERLSYIKQLERERAQNQDLNALILFQEQAIRRKDQRIRELQVRHARIAHHLNSIHCRASWSLTALLSALEHAMPLAVRSISAILKSIWWTVTLQLSARLRRRIEAQAILDSGLFDESWYIENYDDALVQDYRAIVHWIEVGRYRGYRPNKLFHTKWYCEKTGLQVGNEVDPLLHYLKQGAQPTGEPNPLFDSSWYIQQAPEVIEENINPLRHYLEYGWRRRLSPHPLFDTKWYFSRCSHVVREGVEPLSHYLEEGAYEGCDPHPLFDSKWYLEKNRDVAQAEENPLVHYLLYGALEGRNPNPFFDTRWYEQQNPEVSARGINPLVHFVRFGADAMRDPHMNFDMAAFGQMNPDLLGRGVELFARFLSQNRDYGSGNVERFLGGKIEREVASYETKAFPRNYALSLRMNDISMNRVKALALAINTVPYGTQDNLDPIKKMMAQLDAVDDVTFDLFDTLVERRVSEPSDIFRLVGLAEYLGANYSKDYADARIYAEVMARRKSSGPEVTLSEIMAEVKKSLDLPDDKVDQLRALELKYEERLITKKPEGEALYRAAFDAGKQISILTDTYLPKSAIDGILAAAGYQVNQSVGVSCEQNATKEQGLLFDFWLAEEPKRSARGTLHIGDNERSDMEVPRSKGFRTLRVSRSREGFFSNDLLTRSWPDTFQEELSCRLALGLVINRWSNLRVKTTCRAAYFGNPYFLGYATLGPLLIGFLSHLLRFVEKRHTSSIYFLARDGFVLKVAYDYFAEKIGYKLPNSEYLAASRTLCSGASFGSVSDVVEVASVDHFPMRLGDMLRTRFGLGEEDMEILKGDLYYAHGFDSPEDVVTAEDPRKLSFFHALAPVIIRASSNRSKLYNQYLSSFNIDDSSAVVDIGYGATAQKAISHLLGKQVDGLYIITSERAKKRQREGLYCEGWLGNNAPLNHPFFEHVQLWEMFLSASHGSIVEILPGDEEFPQLRFSDNLFAEQVRASLAAIHCGAIDFVKDFISAYEGELNSLTFSPEAFSKPLSEYFSGPNAEDCVYFSEAEFEDSFGGDRRPVAATCDGAFARTLDEYSTVVWQEATDALSALEIRPTPYFPVSPGIVAGNRGLLDVDRCFIDTFDVNGVRPCWETSDYYATFDRDGWPRCTMPAISLRMVLPLVELNDTSDLVIDSWKLQIFSGMSLSVASFDSSIASSIGKEMIGPNVDILNVCCWDEILEALELVSETWVLLTDGYTDLDPLISAEISAYVERNPGTDLVYFDDDWRRSDLVRYAPHFKPGWSPDLLLCTDYFGGAFAVRRNLIEGIKTSSETACGWLWEIALEVSRRTERIGRIPRLLSHRSHERYRLELPQAWRSAEKVMVEIFRSLGVPASMSVPSWAFDSDRLTCQPCFPDEGPAVAIIVPTKNQHSVTMRCIESLARTTYRNYQIYLVDNESTETEALAYFRSLEEHGVRVLKIPSPREGFSYSYVNNRAVEKTEGEPYLLFLNNDTEVIEPRWLSQMVGWMRLPGVGSVGARLLFPDGTIQHAGITHKLLYNVLPAPSLKCLSGSDGGYQDYVYLTRDSAAQTAACLLTSRQLFISHGMFDEQFFSVAYNDCDYGFKLTNAGLRNVYCGDAVLYHHEGYSRGIGRGNDKPSEEAAFVRKYSDWEDPYYNPNLVLGKTNFAVKPTSIITTPVPRLRVALVSHNLEYEGAPRVLMEIGTGLQKNENMDVYVFSPAEGPLRDVYEADGCNVIIVPDAMEVFGYGGEGFHAVKKITGNMIGHRFDVVIANTVLCWWAIESSGMAKIPSIWIIHESEPPFTHLEEHGQEFGERGRQALKIPYRVVFVADATRKVFEGLEEMNNFTVFHNGYDSTSCAHDVADMPRDEARKSLKLPEDKLVGLLPGAVCERKSQVDLVRAIRLVDLDVVGALRLIILGDRPSEYSDILHREIDQLDPERRRCVSVLPYSAGAERYFRAADFMILTSRIEAFPRVIQEAMFFGLPMIVTPVNGVVEQVQDEVSALFFPPGDAVRLSQQIERLVWCSGLRNRLARNSRETLGRFPTVDEMVSYYSKLVKEAWLSA